jgi:FtsZ-binding cell division protein ZapB
MDQMILRLETLEQRLGLTEQYIAAVRMEFDERLKAAVTGAADEFQKAANEIRYDLGALRRGRDAETPAQEKRRLALEAELREERARREQLERRLNEMADERRAIHTAVKGLAGKFGMAE